MSKSDLLELRAEVVAQRGLPPGSAQFVAGETLDELEASADKFAILIAGHGTQEREQAEPMAGLFSDAAAEKAKRQRALVQMLHGPRPQPRDEQGRWTTRPSFDEGARQPAPAEPEGHDTWLLRALSSRAADAGGRL